MSFHSWISLQSPCSFCYLRKEGSRSESQLRKERERERGMIRNRPTAGLRLTLKVIGLFFSLKSSIYQWAILSYWYPLPQLSPAVTNHALGEAICLYLNIRNNIIKLTPSLTTKDFGQDVIHFISSSSLSIHWRSFSSILIPDIIMFLLYKWFIFIF